MIIEADIGVIQPLPRSVGSHQRLEETRNRFLSRGF